MKKTTKTTKRKRKKSIRLVDKDEDLDAAAKQVKPTAKRKKGSPKKKKAATKKKKEPDGSVNRLREERRDLFDLLYGDDDNENSAEEVIKFAANNLWRDS